MQGYQGLGEQLERLGAEANTELLIVAPFIKRHALRRVLEKVSAEVRVSCITRWRLDEIAAGVSDIEIWEDITARSGATLRLLPSLHAKYYRADAQCLIGSANVTGAALGWSGAPNLELLLCVSAAAAGLAGFETVLGRGVLVTEAIYNQVSEAVAALPAGTLRPLPVSDMIVNWEGTRFEDWWPTLRQPEMLESAYLGNWEELSHQQSSAAVLDLAALDVPALLPMPLFIGTVSSLLLQHPAVQTIDEFVGKSRRFGELTDLVQQLAEFPDKEEASRAWQTMMRWLLHFLPSRYVSYVPRHSEIFVRRPGVKPLMSPVRTL